MMGRVVGFRFALVFGSMTLAMAVSGLIAEVVGVGPVLVVFGLITMVAGLAGLSRPGRPRRLTLRYTARVRRTPAAPRAQE